MLTGCWLWGQFHPAARDGQVVVGRRGISGGATCNYNATGFNRLVKMWWWGRCGLWAVVLEFLGIPEWHGPKVNSLFDCSYVHISFPLLPTDFPLQLTLLHILTNLGIQVYSLHTRTCSTTLNTRRRSTVKPKCYDLEGLALHHKSKHVLTICVVNVCTHVIWIIMSLSVLQ